MSYPLRSNRREQAQVSIVTASRRDFGWGTLTNVTPGRPLILWLKHWSGIPVAARTVGFVHIEGMTGGPASGIQLRGIRMQYIIGSTCFIGGAAAMVLIGSLNLGVGLTAVLAVPAVLLAVYGLAKIPTEGQEVGKAGK